MKFNQIEAISDNNQLLKKVNQYHHDIIGSGELEEVWSLIKYQSPEFFETEFKAIPKENILNLKW